MARLGESTEWPWWLYDLQEAAGPIVAGRTYIIGGRPSCGKTLLMQNLMRALAGRSGKPQVMLTGWTERAKPQFLASLASLIEGYNEDLVLRKKWELLPDGAEKKVADRISGIEERPDGFPFIETVTPTSDDIARALETHSPSMFLFDYLQKVRPMRGQNVFDAWMEVMRLCTEYAAQGGTVILGSQLKRKGDGIYDKYRPPFMEDFKGGGGIEEGANLALGLYRPLNRMSSKEEREVKAGRADLEEFKQKGVMAIKILKHTFWGEAADRIVRCRVLPNRRVVNYDYREPEYDQGDAWEEQEPDLPF